MLYSYRGVGNISKKSSKEKGRVDFLLTILHLLFAVLTFGFALYGLLTQNFDYQYFMFLFMGLMFLVMGLKELRNQRKVLAYFLILTAAFILFVAINGYLTF